MLLAAALVMLLGQPAKTPPRPEQLRGLWRGTSTCTDRAAAPACKDEQVVYEFAPGARGSVHWTADKVVDGKRVAIGEMDLAYDAAEAGWKAEYSGPSMTIVWRLVVQGDRLTGTGRLLPGNQVVRRIEARREPRAAHRARR